MALIATSVGWRDDEDTGERVFTVTLRAQTADDVPDVTFDDVWHSTPMTLMRTPTRAEAGAGDGGEG